MIDFRVDCKDEKEVKEFIEQAKEFILSILIKKEQLIDKIENLNEEIRSEKHLKDMWLNRYIETTKEKALLKEELDQMKEGDKEDLEKENMNRQKSYCE